MRRLFTAAAAATMLGLTLTVSCTEPHRPGTITVKWEAALPGTPAQGSTPALGPDASLYVIAASGDTSILCAFSPAGALRWKWTVGQSGASPSVASDGTVYVASGTPDSSCLTALYPDGHVRWWGLRCCGGTLCPAIAADGTIYVVNINGSLQAVSPQGESLWTYEAHARTPSAAAIGPDSTIYLDDGSSSVLAVTPKGKLKWIALVPGASSHSPPVAAPDGTVYVVQGYNWYVPGAVVRLDADGTIRDSICFPRGPNHSPAINSDGALYATDKYAMLYLMDSTGRQRWSRGSGLHRGSANSNCIALTADGMAYYSEVLWNQGNYLTIFRGVDQSGNEVRQSVLPYAVTSSPVIGPDGTIYILTSDCTLVALEGSAPPADAPWPMFMHDARHTGCAAAKQY